MSATSNIAGIVGYYSSADALNEGIERLHQHDIFIVTAYLPFPDESTVNLLLPHRSLVRYGTLAGGLGGIGIAWLMTVLMTLDYPLVVGGKPYIAWPAFLTISYEFMIIGGTVFAAASFLFLSYLPNLSPSDAYHPRFVVDRFALYVPYQEERFETAPEERMQEWLTRIERGRIERAMLEAGAMELHEVVGEHRGRLQVVE